MDRRAFVAGGLVAALVPAAARAQNARRLAMLPTGSPSAVESHRAVANRVLIGELVRGRWA